MPQSAFIYALCEPGSRRIRYIGKSIKPKKRLSSHCTESVKSQNHLGHWILSLGGLIPELLILREVPLHEWEEWEKRYIRSARALGFDLVNYTDGGNAPPTFCGSNHPMYGKHHSEQSRLKMRLSHLGHPSPRKGKIVSLIHRARLSEAHKGKKLSDSHKKRIRLSLTFRKIFKYHNYAKN